MVAVVLVSAWTVCAQTPATLTDLGATVPTPGSSDISQLSSGGNTKFPDTLNYYTDNQTDHSAGEPGQTFTTGGNAGGYALTSLSLKTAGLDSGGGSPGGSINYLLHIYSVAGGNVTLPGNLYQCCAGQLCGWRLVAVERPFCDVVRKCGLRLFFWQGRRRGWLGRHWSRQRQPVSRR